MGESSLIQVDFLCLKRYKMPMSQRIEVFTVSEDGRAKTYAHDFAPIAPNLKNIRVVDVYTIEQDITESDKLETCLSSFTNPVTQKSFVLTDSQAPANDYWDVSIRKSQQIPTCVGMTKKIMQFTALKCCSSRVT